MKQFIKNAIVYSATLPSEFALEEHFAENQFTELMPSQIRSVGFVPVRPIDDATELVTCFTGGVAFRVRVDEKVLPAAAVRKEVDKLAAQLQLQTGRRPGKKERKELEEAARYKMALVAFPKSAEITCFYEASTRYLIIPTTSKALAGLITHLMVQAVGSIKTDTINVSSVKHGLTTRLSNWMGHQADGLDDSAGVELSHIDAFGHFQPRGEVSLAQEKRRINVKMSSLLQAETGITAALKQGFQVTALGMTDGATNFRLNGDFTLSGIDFEDDETPTENSTFADFAALEVRAVSRVVAALCEMLAYQEAAEEDEAEVV